MKEEEGEGREKEKREGEEEEEEEEEEEKVSEFYRKEERIDVREIGGVCEVGRGVEQREGRGIIVWVH